MVGPRPGPRRPGRVHTREAVEDGGSANEAPGRRRALERPASRSRDRDGGAALMGRGADGQRRSVPAGARLPPPAAPPTTMTFAAAPRAARVEEGGGPALGPDAAGSPGAPAEGGPKPPRKLKR